MNTSKHNKPNHVSPKGNSIINFFKKYKHAWTLVYLFVYFPWFFYLEKTITTNYTSIHIRLDDLIPFNELFIIPYYLWFMYVAVVIAFLLFTSKEEYYRCCAFLFIGMTICLTIYTIWPNGQDLRPTTFARDNFLVDIAKKLYASDTSTNVCPSIHVFNSIGIHIAVMHSSRLKNNHLVRRTSCVLCILICLSTVFLKQHSAFDGIAAMILSVFMYLLVYVPNYTKLFNKKQSLCETHNEV
ncbi:phosphatase PAP2 family protein [Anaerosporobacter faecicola]|uniref:phosphatase PAP2 family protein n=1 Tax=Anaerosporobacter faecicola TaxID=2718714 RepID=UPI002ED55F2E